MAEERNVDFGVVARVARRVELVGIRLVDLSAKLLSEPTEALIPKVEHKCRQETSDGAVIVECGYSFTVSGGETTVAEINATYQLLYKIKGEEPIPELDLSQFAYANGTYHSWPFLRQLVFDITARIGFPPYTLPTFLFNPEVKQRAQEVQAKESVPTKA